MTLPYKLANAVSQALGLMRDNPLDPLRQGYTFANALNAIAEYHDLDRIEEAIVAEQMAKAIANDPMSYSIFNPDPIPNA